MIDWKCKTFQQLDVDELYEVLKLRQEVFIIEQQCLYNDIDELDKSSLHLIGYGLSGHVAREICVYARIIAPGIKSPEAAIGRVLVNEKFRRGGYGVALMERALLECRQNFNASAVKISAQAHLEKFYQGLGFATLSEPYDEDGIPHIDMIHQG